MQAGLRPYVQDENALAGLHRAGGVKGGGLGGEAGGAKALGKATPGFPTMRKALGNITNRGGGLDENAPPGKTPAAGAAPRRALGDITNSSAAGSVQRAQLKAPVAAGLAPQQAVQPPAAAAAAAAAPADCADALAEGGVERCFGRGWQQLERERLAREDEESSRRLAALAAFPGRGLPNFFPLWGAVGMSQQQVLQKDALPSPPASPLAQRPPSAGLPDLSLPDTIDVALPDVPMSDSFLDDWD
ncbi:hypothetical protein C2E21_3934 [Chlorella sorokiniana]|uniref:Uncharacterized protein n=1 Tax=Chlorella sorokiniana TaxID=3076 RepID=A0A2P6TT73_CHLSO|nr:hypothetical protein C2E21_3934 [Chlorella sorokiniana]|eukprot:PRW57261.1 hypothetical protein C2E21_3934 [Chlorella sorokiniana]